MASIQVPNLGEKLRLLMNNNYASGIHTQKALAKKLEIAEANISNWIIANAVPEKQLPSLCRVFSIDQKDFGNLPLQNRDDEERFLKAVRPHLGSVWHRLSSFCKRDNLRVHFIKPNDGINTTNGKRPLKDEDEIEDEGDKIETLRVKDKLRLQFTGSEGWHVIALLRDPQETIDCLSPSKLTSTTQIGTQERFYLPETEGKYLKATPPEGINELIVLLCKDLWPDPIMHDLTSADHQRRLSAVAQIANLLKPAEEIPTFEAFKKEFYISHT